MIKLIVSDMDGTLVPTGSSEMDPEFLLVLEEALQRNFLFCACSGREYKALKMMFPGFESQIYLSCQNGNVLFHKHKLIYHNPLDRTLAKNILQDILLQDECMCLISNDAGYYMIDYPGLEEKISGKNFPFEVTVVNSLDQVPGDINQLTLRKAGGASKYLAYFTSRWGDKLNVMLSSENCIDFCNNTKADAVGFLCETLSIMPEEVMAFGDNYNDLTMLEMVGSGYIMDNAPKDLLEKFPNHCSSVKNVIQSVFEKKETE